MIGTWSTESLQVRAHSIKYRDKKEICLVLGVWKSHQISTPPSSKTETKNICLALGAHKASPGSLEANIQAEKGENAGHWAHSFTRYKEFHRYKDRKGGFSW